VRPVMAFTTVPLADFVIEQGEQSLGRVRATELGTRRFCRDCGTPLTIQVDFQPDTRGLAN
jgi:hypothetical protein